MGAANENKQKILSILYIKITNQRKTLRYVITHVPHVTDIVPKATDLFGFSTQEFMLVPKP